MTSEVVCASLRAINLVAFSTLKFHKVKYAGLPWKANSDTPKSKGQIVSGTEPHTAKEILDRQQWATGMDLNSLRGHGLKSGMHDQHRQTSTASGTHKSREALSVGLRQLISGRNCFALGCIWGPNGAQNCVQVNS